MFKNGGNVSYALFLCDNAVFTIFADFANGCVNTGIVQVARR